MFKKLDPLVYLPLWVIVLVPDQYPVDHLAVGVDLVEPPLDVGETLAGGDVVDDDHPVGPPVVGARDGPEPLLARRVPDLQLHLLSVKFYRTDFEIYT